MNLPRGNVPVKSDAGWARLAQKTDKGRKFRTRRGFNDYRVPRKSLKSGR